jgi:hypothetical protein
MLLAGAARAADPVTNANGPMRTGWYPDESPLHPQLITDGSFGQIFSAPVDGQVYAQPLVSNGVLLVATENNRVYGLDPKTGAEKWSRNLGPAFDATVPPASCDNINPTVGVTGTPVIDPDTGTAYLFAKTYASGTSGDAAYEAHAIDVTTGDERPGFPVRITGPADNNAQTSFNPTLELQRPGLLLMDGVVYAGFGGHCDHEPYQGWVVGVSTAGAVRSRWVDRGGANQSGGGIWQSGGGLVSDGPGRILLATGNGFGDDGSPSPPTAGNNPPASLGESVVRLAVQSDGTLRAADFFAPYDAAQLDTFDADVGSGSPVALPDSFGTVAHPHLLVQMTKGGYVYLLDRDHLGGSGMGADGGDDVVQRIGPYDGVWARPAVWPGDGGYVYAPNAYVAPLRVYHAGVDAGGNPSLALVASSSDSFALGSGSPVVTSSGLQSGSAVVWIVRFASGDGAGAELRAYQAVPDAGQPQLLWSAPVGTAAKFASPGIADGRVYVGTGDGHVLGFGSPIDPAVTAPSASFPGVLVGQHATRTVTLTAARDLTITGLSTTSPEFALDPAPSLPVTLSAGDTLDVPITFTPSGDGPKGATLGVATSAGEATVGLAGTGVLPDPQLTLTPPSVSFGGTSVGSHVTGTATIANTGGAPLTIGSVDPLSAPFSVADAPAAGTKLGPGEALVVNIHFDPTAIGRYSDALTVHSDGGDESAGISGTAGDPPTLHLSSTLVQFDPLHLGESSSASFVLSNTGGSPLDITKSQPPPGGEFTAAPNDLPEGTELQPGASITQTVVFHPHAVGEREDSWTITGDDGQGQQFVRFHGTGAADGSPLPAAVAPAVVSPFPMAVLSHLRVRPKRVPRHRWAHATFHMSRAGVVRFVLRCPVMKRCRALRWSVNAAAGGNRVRLPRRASGRYRLVAAPAGGQARNVSLRVLPR